MTTQALPRLINRCLVIKSAELSLSPSPAFLGSALGWTECHLSQKLQI